MKSLGKRQRNKVYLNQTQAFCNCRCSCGFLNFKENAQNAAPTWVTVSLIEPMFS